MHQLHSYNEVVFSVKDIQIAAKTYTDLLGWQIVWQGQGHRSQLDFWDLAPNCTTDEVLLQFQGLTYGQIRLVRFNGVSQQIIRSAGQPFDNGGIMDIDIRVSDINWVYDQMTECNWHAYTQPVTQTMGPFSVEEVLFRGHDGVVIAFVHRTAPPHPNPFGLTGATSNVYLSAIVVKDIKAASHFFINQLGFVVHNQIEFVGDESRSIFNLPHNIAAQTKALLSIIGPTDSRDALFDLIELEGIKGEDFSSLAVPPNRGILMYRIPVTDIQSYYDFVLRNGIVPKCLLTTIDIQPIGTIKTFAVQSPDGVWVEFWEAV